MQLKRGRYTTYLFRKYIERHWNNIKRLAQYKTLDMFIAVNIETINMCNLSCSLCPMTLYPKPFPKKMDYGIFLKIINDLRDMGFRGVIHLHNYGEPLLDDRLGFLVMTIKRLLPYCTVTLFTNGTLLTDEYRENLKKYGVDNFEIYKENWDKGYIIYNRGGLIKLPDSKPMGKCKVHLDCLIIDVNGDVILCCNDYFSRYKFGNVEDKSIKEIWNSPRYRTARKRIARGAKFYTICKECRYREVT